jgi:hypothetical protein
VDHGPGTTLFLDEFQNGLWGFPVPQVNTAHTETEKYPSRILFHTPRFFCVFVSLVIWLSDIPASGFLFFFSFFFVAEQDRLNFRPVGMYFFSL